MAKCAGGDGPDDRSVACWARLARRARDRVAAIAPRSREGMVADTVPLQGPLSPRVLTQAQHVMRLLVPVRDAVLLQVGCRGFQGQTLNAP